MMKYNIRIFCAAAFLLSLISCTEKDEPALDNFADYRFEFSAIKSLGDDSSVGQGSVATRLLTEYNVGENRSDLKATFKKGDLVYMYKVPLDNSRNPVVSSYKKDGVLTAKDDGVESDLEGRIDPDLLAEFYEDNGHLVPNNDNFALYFFYKHDPADGFVFRGQKGTLDDIDLNFDYASAEIFTYNAHCAPPDNWSITSYLEIDRDNKTISIPNKIRFYSQQSIFKFKLLDKSGQPIKAEKFTIETEVYDEGSEAIHYPYGIDYDYNDVFIQSFAPLADNNDLQKGKIEVNLDTESDCVYVALAGTSSASLNNGNYERWSPRYLSWRNLLTGRERNIIITATTEAGLTYRYNKPFQSYLSHCYFYNIEVWMDDPQP